MTSDPPARGYSESFDSFAPARRLKRPGAYDAGIADWREKSLGNELGAQMKLVADNVEVIVLPNTGHWILEEPPKETAEALVNFL